MDLLLESESDSENDEILEVTTKDPGGSRSSYRNKQLLKMFAIREILKWKYNYFETNAHEHPLYKLCEGTPRSFRKSFAFKKLWRLRMDKEYDVETIKMHKIFLERQLKKLSQSQHANASLSHVVDPGRLLANYDREVLRMIREQRDVFNFYLLYPKSYPLYEAEKKNFLIDQCINAAENITQISMDDIDKRFRIYWENRVAILCDLKISQEKKKIRRNWKRLLPVYHDLGEDTCSELQELLMSDGLETDEE